MRSHPNAIPTWPPVAGAYDYLLQLNDAELAWEFLRRNTDYRQAVDEHRDELADPRQLASGQRLWRIRAAASAARRSGLFPFRRSGPAGAPGAGLLVGRLWRRRT